MAEEESREEKNKRIEELMNNMRIKNQQYLERHREVEKDRIEAERKGSAITKTVPKVSEQFRKSQNIQPHISHQREWDRGRSPEGDYSHFRRNRRNTWGSSWGKEHDKKYSQYSNFDSKKKSNNEAYGRRHQESRPFGHFSRRTRGYNKKNESSYKYPQNWRSEQRKNVDIEDSSKLPKESEENERVWRLEYDSDEARTKQKRVANWLDTLKNVKEWDNENPSNIYRDTYREDDRFQDKSQCWDDQSAKEQRYICKTVKYENKSTTSGSTDAKLQKNNSKFKTYHGEDSKNVKELEHFNNAKAERMLMLKKNYANMDLSIPPIRQHTYQQRNEPNFSSEENTSETRAKIGKSADQKPNYPRGRGRGLLFFSHSSANKLQTEQRQVGDRPTRGKKIDQEKLRSRSNNYKPIYQQKKKSNVRTSETSLSDQEAENVRLIRGDTDEIKKFVKEAESEGIWSDLDTDETRLAYERSIEKRKKCIRTKLYEPGKIFQKQSEGISSDIEAENDKELQKIQETEFSRNIYEVECKAKKSDIIKKTTSSTNKESKERESEGIWSDLDTEETRLAYEKSVKEKCQRTQDYESEKMRDQEAEVKGFQETSNQETEFSRENIYVTKYPTKKYNTAKTASSSNRHVGARPARGKKMGHQEKLRSRSNNFKPMHQQKKKSDVRTSKTSLSDQEAEKVRLVYEDNDGAKKVVKETESEGICSDLDTDETRLAHERYVERRKKCLTTKLYESGKIFQEQSEGICSDLEAEDDKEFKKTESIMKKTTSSSNKEFKERESEGIWSDLDTEETRLAYEQSVKKECQGTKNYQSENILQEQRDGMQKDQESEEVKVCRIASFSGTHKKLQPSTSKISSPIACIKHTAYSEQEPKRIQTLPPTKSSEIPTTEACKTYTVQEPKTLPQVSIHEEKKELMSKGKKPSEKLICALKGSKKDYKDKDK